jgi:hypothetical protein
MCREETSHPYQYRDSKTSSVRQEGKQREEDEKKTNQPKKRSVEKVSKIYGNEKSDESEKDESGKSV